MAKQRYRYIRFTDSSLSLIDKMNRIVERYIEQGLRLTVRQLYYQLVAHDLFPDERRWKLVGNKKWKRDPEGTKNAEPNYKWMCALANDARIAGLMDWDAVEDRMRSFARRARWDSGQQILNSAAETFHMDMWVYQPWRPFVIVEKDALSGVLDGVCHELDIPMLAARGYPSGSVLREFALSDILPSLQEQRVLLIHLGDHDPSGIDMTGDLERRLSMFCEGSEFKLERVALTMEQIQEHRPPPNPAKTTDTRFNEYRRQFGDESWELDALEPSYLVKLVRDTVDKYRDLYFWEARVAEVEAVRSQLRKVAGAFEG